ncbi:MAG: hypothetical protein ABI589_14275 [Burkholderiales bacterium]
MLQPIGQTDQRSRTGMGATTIDAAPYAFASTPAAQYEAHVSDLVGLLPVCAESQNAREGRRRLSIHKEILMLKTVTATYPSPAALSNAVDDLINAGIPSEKIHRDDTTRQVKVMVPETGVAGARELLNRHDPTNVT